MQPVSASEARTANNIPTPYVDRDEFRKCCARFTTGVAVAACRAGGSVHGVTISSFSSVTLDPPTVLFCLHRQSQVLKHFLQAGCFGISVLADSQRALADRFAVADLRHLGAPCFRDDNAVPLIDQALAGFECRLTDCLQAGSHYIMLGAVTAVHRLPGHPLLRFDSEYRGLDLGDSRAQSMVAERS